MESTQSAMRWYGYSGLLPFIVLPAIVMVSLEDAGLWRDLYVTYSAVILGFMAGTYWPLGLRSESNTTTPAHGARLMAIAITVALVACLAVILPPLLSAICFSAAFALLLMIDRFVLADYWPADYLRMRGHLTAVVIASQAAMVLAAH